MKKEMELVRQDMLAVLGRIEGAAEALGWRRCAPRVYQRATRDHRKAVQRI